MLKLKSLLTGTVLVFTLGFGGSAFANTSNNETSIKAGNLQIGAASATFKDKDTSNSTSGLIMTGGDNKLLIEALAKKNESKFKATADKGKGASFESKGDLPMLDLLPGAPMPGTGGM